MTLFLLAPGSAKLNAEPYKTSRNVFLALPRLVWNVSTHHLGKLVVYNEHNDLYNHAYDLIRIKTRTFEMYPCLKYRGEAGHGVVLNVGFFNKSDRETFLKTSFIYSGPRRKRGELTLACPGTFGGGQGSFDIHVDVLDNYHKDASINAGVKEDSLRSFEIQQSNARFELGWKPATEALDIKPHFELSAWAGPSAVKFQPVKGGEGPLANPNYTNVARQLPGIGESLKYARLGASLRYDRRDFPGDIPPGHKTYEYFPGRHAKRANQVLTHQRDRSYPTRGILFDISGEWVKGNKDIHFLHGKSEVQWFLPLFRHGRVLAVRAKVEKIHRPPGSLVPYTDLVRSGGDHESRGFDKGFFTGLASISFSAEYRYPIWDTWNAFLFWDEGQVFDYFSQASFGGFRTSYGGGISVRGSRSLIIKLFIGYSDQNTRRNGVPKSQEF